MEKEIIEQYKKIVYYFGELLGPTYEVILHVLTSEKESYIGAIANGELSGRSLTNPLTDFALNLIEDKVYLEKEFITGYKGTMSNGKEFRSSTLFIKDSDGKLTGLLCINFDIDQYKYIAKDILGLAQIILPLNDLTAEHTNPYIENFSNSVRDIVLTVIDSKLLSPDVKLSQNQKIEIIEILEEKGVFQIKGAVVEVAATLTISEASVYRYLQAVMRKKEA
ncbi:Predicted transcriptional regulator YheO, contains PAS and DNA-binding HTH domains [Carnobacterium iners]|uniref:Predicted transcriptional regulator YheO, contains PAS and DNA-binding HTH domains n=1 Tax=Carnobacterium iners TaxID=1073423 RepID=A0A1X7N874_9LACT|nr:PAS domain-containing protein [Carnobacterium iners]SEK46531.1 Predicted transcriptional regulator YheO, contains PAS and DNA-binding HTH domains [Carnobacterium iners]SMH33120.1 Predicted transcriptional regulator YheO, contains PAS and DNA-binding HTH domains [Carnobacterium iners]